MATPGQDKLRQLALEKQRKEAQDEFERKKAAIVQETEKARPSTQRFVGQNDSMEDTLKQTTVGLVYLDDFTRRREELEEMKAREAAKTAELKTLCGIPPFGGHDYGPECTMRWTSVGVWCTYSAYSLLVSNLRRH
ncbi:hypothetical protein EXIGLDRAFT_771280 [Exidia glandulosa HHB12029]|uniref:Uncharacterized protein n=1 Tax=Exidia glandulosa HHB12029 TaxID=1314781 RepID=A0A165G339_EXIGL|nr:hypothetical protein EXIGLDRAFT_771280 [Exidia glandulosa HHB12029]